LEAERCIEAGLVNRESLLANRSVLDAGGVVMEREQTLGCVSGAIDVVRKCTMADRGVFGASCVPTERIPVPERCQLFIRTTMKRFPSPRYSSAIQIVRPSQSRAHEHAEITSA